MRWTRTGPTGLAFFFSESEPGGVAKGWEIPLCFAPAAEELVEDARWKGALARCGDLAPVGAHYSQENVLEGRPDSEIHPCGIGEITAEPCDATNGSSADRQGGLGCVNSASDEVKP